MTKIYNQSSTIVRWRIWRCQQMEPFNPSFPDIFPGLFFAKLNIDLLKFFKRKNRAHRCMVYFIIF